MVGEAVIEAARELLGARNYPSVVAVATSALDEHPENIEMRLLRARALLGLRRDEEAQVDLRECLRRKTRCAIAYRLLGELCFRRDELESAAVFLREALRLEPDDQHSLDLLTVIRGLSQISSSCIKPTAVVEKLPAATAAVGPFSRVEPPVRRGRIAHGTYAPDDDLFAPTEVDASPVSAVQQDAYDEVFDELTDTDESADSLTVADPPDPYVHAGLDHLTASPPTVTQRPRSRRAAGSSFEGSIERRESDGAGFGSFLLRIGAVTPSELGRARRFQQELGDRSAISLAEAVVRLGFASEPTIATASLAYRAEQLAR